MTTTLDMANWWGECFVLADKKADFIDAVARRIARALEHGERLLLYVDYDPNEPLLDVLREIGVECRGSCFSAKGIFSGGKFGMVISADGDVQVKHGYGQGWQWL